MIAIIGIVLLVLYVTLNLILLAIKNRKAHQFFKTKSPNLPVLPNPKIFSGHIYEVTKPLKNWKVIKNLHEQYGPTFGFYLADQPWVVTKDIELVKLLNLDEAYKHINRVRYGVPFEEFNNSIFQLEDDNWRKTRRAISPAFTNHKVRSDEVSTDIEYIANKLNDSFKSRIRKAEHLTGQRSVIIDAGDMASRYTLSVIFLITYKKDNIVDFDADTDHWTETLEAGLRDVSHPMVGWSVMFPFLRPIFMFLIKHEKLGRAFAKTTEYIVEATDIHRKARELHQKFKRKVSEVTGERERDFSEIKRQGEFKRRLVDTIIDALLEKKMGYDEFIGSTIFLLFAGFETTADTITCLMWHLSREQQVQDRLRKEIIENGIDADYVLWCIMETIRWHPAAPLGIGRVANHDVTINGNVIPKGSFVMTSTYCIHHDDSNWPEADKFKPERWRDANDRHPASFMGFGLGPRNCLGGKLAIHMVKLAISILLRSYKIEVCPETPDKFEFTTPGLIYTIQDEPIKVKLTALDGNDEGS